MVLGMSEKIDKILESNAEIRQSYKSLLSLMKGFVAGCSLVLLLIITFMIDTRSDISTIKAVLATKDNIVKLREEIRQGDLKLHNEMGVYISLVSYIAIETKRSMTVADLFYDFGRVVNIKDEELERFRTSAIFKLNSDIKLGTTRGQ